MINFQSQIGQDIFVANYFDFLKGGNYLEIGAGHPRLSNNTYFLEKELGWKGISIEYNEQVLGYWYNFRDNPLYAEDAYTFDYKRKMDEYFGEDKTVHYLSLDLDENIRHCVECLEFIPFSEYDIKVISIETDFYDNQDEENRKKQRRILSSLGYTCVFLDVCLERHGIVEDFWIKDEQFKEKPLQVLKNMDYKEGLNLWGYL